MTTPKKTECIVCYQEKFISPCGANNNCGVYVCIDCKFDFDAAHNNSDGIMNDNLFNCMICKKPEHKLSVVYRYHDHLHNFLLDEGEYGYEVWNAYSDRMYASLKNN